MKYIKFLFFFVFVAQLNAQILNMPENIQEHDQWCWAGVTKSILDFYGNSYSQCQIADYARQRITWHDFGNTNCCVNANAGCNYWNYAYGANGSMQDILVHFGNIQNYGVAHALTISQISNELTANKPFIVRWGWNSGGGHFVVGYGISGNNIYSMNPWFNEGLHISTYNWLKNDGNHTWTHTNIITTSPALNLDDYVNSLALNIFPNPTKEYFRIESSIPINKILIYNSLGQVVLKTKQVDIINVSQLSKGLYSLKIFIAEKVFVKKLILK